MPEHLIRLRGGWTVETPGRSTSLVTLPADWPTELVMPFRLIRRFNAPRIDPSGETLRLRLERVAGLVAARLNDVEIAGSIAGRSDLTLLLDGPLPERNVLVLDVDPAGWSLVGDARNGWGAIALAIESS